MHSYSTLVDVVRQRAAEAPEQPVFTFLADGEEEVVRLTRGELDRRARAVAARLQGQGAEGERALLLYPPGLELVVAFLGCLYAGVVAVPTYPPRRRRDLGRLRPLLADARPGLALTTEALGARVRERLAAETVAPIPLLATDRLDDGDAGLWRPPDLAAERLAFLQYTSGSTADPKGVMVTHGNLLANQRWIERGFGQSAASVVVGWLPLYHDMGLIGNVLQPLYNGGRAILMSPLAFLTRPRRWLAAIGRYRATTSGGPDFAFRLCVEKISAAERAGLDLSTWSCAFDGAEPVRADTLERFTRAFAPWGFSRRAWFPCYGLAEATLFVSGGAGGGGPVVRRVDAAALEEAGRAEPAPGEAARATALVGCGRGEGAEARVVIADPESAQRLPSGRVGEVWVAGPGVAAGYWGRCGETARSFGAHLAPDGEGPFLRTGDLGFLDDDGTLFLTGRIKDLIILRGRNVYPHDVEAAAVASHPALRVAGAAAFAVEAGGEERLALVAEVERGREGEATAAIAALRRALLDEHEVQPEAVVLIRAGTLPRTSSGKVRRHACATAYREGRLVVVAEGTARDARGNGTEPPGQAAGEQLAGLPVAERQRRLTEALRARAERLLGVAAGSLGADDRLDLDSLAAVELRNHLAALAGVELPLESFLGGTRLDELARAAASAGRGAAGPTLERGSETGDHPLSHGQRSLWFLHRLAPASAAYNLAFAARLRGAGAPLDRDALSRAFAGLVERHGALRTTFHAVDGEPVQRVASGSAAALEVIDATGWSAGERAAALTGAAEEPFDLERGPVLRGRLFAGGDDDVLLVAVHHIAADLGSLVVMLDDLAGLYTSEAGQGAPDPLAPPAIAYTDFVRWQEGRLRGPRGSELWDYWRERLAGDPPAADLPTDRPRRPAESHHGEVVPLRLAPGPTAAARALAEAAGTTLFAVLLGVFQLLLHRLGGQRDFLVGTPLAGRVHAGLEGLVGYLVNPMPLRAEAAGDPPFAAFLARTRESVLGALEHQDFPFPLLVERLGRPRDPARHPLFQAVFALQRPHRLAERGVGPFVLGRDGARLRRGALELASVEIERRATPLDLVLTAVESEGGVDAALSYGAELFDRTTAARLAAAFTTLAEAAVTAPHHRLSELALLRPAERHQLALEYNDSDCPFPAASSVGELFAATAGERPEAVAVVADGPVPGHLSYGWLRRESRLVAARLRRLGVGPEVAVAVALPRSPELVVTLLAVLEAGGFHLVLDPEIPAQRLAFCLQEMRPAVLVTAAGHPPPAELPHPAPTLLTPGTAPPPVGGAALPRPTVLPDNLMLALYTSGSTGRPKAIGITHRGVARLVSGRALFDLGPQTVLVEICPVTFDGSTLEIYGTLANGGRLVIPPPEPPSLAELGDAFARHRVAAAVFPAGLLHLMIDEALGSLAGLRQLISGGDVLSPVHAARVRRELPAVELMNAYGPAESTTATTRQVVAAGGGLGAIVPIGRPIENTTVHLLDRRMEPVPAGRPGALWIGGPGLARGYLGRPALTAASFAPSPFAGSAEATGGRLYRSGDLARRLPDGRLVFLGRHDRQVKLRGFRVEPEEVEVVLAEHPRVKEAVVIARGGGLVAYMVAAEGGELPPAAELRAFAVGRLPAFMIPSWFVPLAAVPLTGHAKVDYAALPAPEATVTRLAPGAPASELEELLAGIWREVLGGDEVGLETSFFELGGHSLLLLKAHSRMEEALGRRIALIESFHHPTIRSLAAWLAEEGAARGLARSELDARAGRRRAALGRRRRAMRDPAPAE